MNEIYVINNRKPSRGGGLSFFFFRKLSSIELYPNLRKVV